MIEAGFDILNLDAYLYAQNLCLYAETVKNFLEGGGYIAWGIIPTLNKEALECINLEEAVQVFDNAIGYLTARNIDRSLIVKQSIITPSCGAGGLDEKLARKAMELTVLLSKELQEQYK